MFFLFYFCIVMFGILYFTQLRQSPWTETEPVPLLQQLDPPLDAKQFEFVWRDVQWECAQSPGVALHDCRLEWMEQSPNDFDLKKRKGIYGVTKI